MDKTVALKRTRPSVDAVAVLLAKARPFVEEALGRAEESQETEGDYFRVLELYDLLKQIDEVL